LLSELYFSPNGDSIKDSTTITGTLNQSASWTVTIRNPASTSVQSFAGNGTSVSAVWNGRDTAGQVLPDAVYTVEVSATGTAGTRVIGLRPVTLDNTAPVTAIGSPASGTVISNGLSVPVNGSANDSYLVNFTLQYGVGSAPSSWTNINSQTTTGVTNSLLGAWTVSSIDGTVGLVNGPYVLRLTTSDKAGNAGVVQRPVTLNLLSITGVTQGSQIMNTSAGEQLQVNFTLGAAGTAYLRIYSEADGTLVREISQVFSAGGAQSLTWNGLNTANVLLPDEAYNYVLVLNDGARTATYDPPRPAGEGSGSGTVDSSFNANKNDFWKMNYTMNHFGRIRMQVTGCTTPTHYPYNWVAYPPGTHLLTWDGRGADGQLASGSCNIYFDPPQYMKPASVIIRGAKPVITGTSASPNIEVKSNPYRITHSYEQISKITYRIDQDSYVTVKLLPPGISDPSDPQAVVLVSNEMQAASSGGQPADHVIEWKGYQTTDTNNIAVSAEGAYTFAITAVGVSSQVSTTYRGALQLWQ
jgi:flagellar hook assembly protein FlgD